MCAGWWRAAPNNEALGWPDRGKLDGLIGEWKAAIAGLPAGPLLLIHGNRAAVVPEQPWTSQAASVPPCSLQGVELAGAATRGSFDIGAPGFEPV